MNSDTIRKALVSVLHGQAGKFANAEDYLQSAVTVPLIDVDGEPSVLFEVRSGKLNRQPGEICFPGGRIEAHDTSPLQAALRETVEELGVKREKIQVLGTLDFLVSPIGVLIYPYAVHISAALPLAPNADEVAEVFTVPLDFLFAAKPRIASMEMATKPLAGFPFDLLPPDYPQGYRRRAKYPLLFYQYKHYVIWGLTARVLANFIEVCRQGLGGDYSV
ncbi:MULTISPECIES: CoA pyrophosphatase [Sporomusa]|jgi:coenzyme A diphosphatase NUDT7|uniref:NUDIX hydrolase n=1 Tax=Sporomusa TaxID=2375 RepID=UPI001662F68F|nr:MULTISPECIES: CoA pyrophosphatase [Sporomusa]MCM0760356.1 CoA pyrophosphatase [Sporomusa sphaeroides DSM 2875]